MDLMSLMIRIGADTAAAQKGIASIQKNMSDATKTGKTFGDKMKTVGKVLKTAFTAVAIKKVADGLVNLATNAASTADHIDKMSQKIGISRTAYQELDFVMSQSGTSVDNLQAGMKTLTAAMDKVKEGNEDTTNTFKKLGIEVVNSDGTFRSQEDVFFDTVSALQGVEDQTEKSRLATELFGRSGLELMPLLNGAAGSMEEMRNQAHELGLVMDDDAVDAGVKLTDTIDQVKRAFGAIVTQIGVQLMPVIQNVLNWVLEHMPVIQSVVSSAIGVVRNVISTLVAFISENIVPVLNAIITFTSETLVPAIVTAWQNTIKPAIETAINAIAGFWNNTLKPAWDEMMSWVRDTLIPTISKGWTGFRNTVRVVFNAIANFWKTKLKPAFDELQEFVVEDVVPAVQTAWEDLQPKIEAVFNAIKGFWENTLQPALGAMWTWTTENLIPAIRKAWQDLQPKVEAVFNAIKGFWENTLEPTFEAIRAFVVDTVVPLIVEAWNTVSPAVKAVFEAISTWWTEHGEGIINGISETIGTVVEGIKGFLDGMIQFITGVFSGDWESAWEGIKKAFGAVFSGLWKLLKDPINGVIKGLNFMIDKVESAINGVIKSINKHLKIEIPPIEVFGKTVWEGATFGPQLKTVNWGRLKYLAKGGILGEGQRALVGELAPEYLTVRNGRAVVTPIKGAERFGGNTITNNFNIYQREGENMEQLAQRINDILVRQERQRRVALA